MPEQEDSTPETPTPAVAIPPIIDPARFEDFTVFRETFLVYFSDVQVNKTVRDFGDLVFSMMLEYWKYWPDQPEGYIRAQLRAAIADMRQTQGYLASMAQEGGHHDPHERHLLTVAGLIAQALGLQATRLEEELGKWRGEGVEP